MGTGIHVKALDLQGVEGHVSLQEDPAAPARLALLGPTLWHLSRSAIPRGQAVSLSVLKEAAPAPASGYSSAYSSALTMSRWWALVRTITAACAGITGDNLSSSYWCSQ